MKINQRSLNLSFGNKGFVFVLDAAIAAILVVAILTATTFFVLKSERDILPKLQIVRTGSDIVSVLDYMGYINPLDGGIIETQLYNLLPSNYEMKIRLDGTIPHMIEVGNLIIPDDRFVGSGEHFFIVSELNEIKYYGKARFWIWLK